MPKHALSTLSSKNPSVMRCSIRSRLLTALRMLKIVTVSQKVDSGNDINNCCMLNKFSNSNLWSFQNGVCASTAEVSFLYLQ